MTAEFIGFAYTDDKDYSHFEKVSLGRFAANARGGWNKANEKALAKLERKFPEAWMFEVRKVGWSDY
jgi:hypothetical protein